MLTKYWHAHFEIVDATGVMLSTWGCSMAEEYINGRMRYLEQNHKTVPLCYGKQSLSIAGAGCRELKQFASKLNISFKELQVASIQLLQRLGAEKCLPRYLKFFGPLDAVPVFRASHGPEILWNSKICRHFGDSRIHNKPI